MSLMMAWRRLVPGADELGARLLERWSEPHRHYHTPDHLAAVLAVVDEYADLAGDADAVRLAAWWHDAVYDPRAEDNEERSAALAEAALPAVGVPAARVADADLAILAAPAAAYDRYAAAVRREYAHVPDGAFRAGRAAVLERLAALPELFRTVPPRRRWEAAARENLARELRALR